MSEYRYNKISPSFWTDRKVQAWDDDTRLLALYIMTCEHRSTEGLFRLPKAYICADLGWSPERLDKPFATLLRDDFIRYDETVSVMLLTNALKWNPTDNANHAKGAAKRVSVVPETPLLADFIQLAERYDKRLYEALVEQYGEPQAQTQAQTQTLTQAQYNVDPPGPTPPDPPPKPKFDEGSIPYQLALHLRSVILNRDPDTRVPADNPKALEGWAVEADRMIRLDKRDPREAAELMVWCQQDPFWSANILSMGTFRKQYDKLKRQRDTRASPTPLRTPKAVPDDTPLHRRMRERGKIL